MRRVSGPGRSRLVVAFLLLALGAPAGVLAADRLVEESVAAAGKTVAGRVPDRTAEPDRYTRELAAVAAIEVRRRSGTPEQIRAAVSEALAQASRELGQAVDAVSVRRFAFYAVAAEEARAQARGRPNATDAERQELAVRGLVERYLPLARAEGDGVGAAFEGAQHLQETLAVLKLDRSPATVRALLDRSLPAAAQRLSPSEHAALVGSGARLAGLPSADVAALVRVTAEQRGLPPGDLDALVATLTGADPTRAGGELTEFRHRLLERKTRREREIGDRYLAGLARYGMVPDSPPRVMEDERVLAVLDVNAAALAALAAAATQGRVTPETLEAARKGFQAWDTFDRTVYGPLIDRWTDAWSELTHRFDQERSAQTPEAFQAAEGARMQASAGKESIRRQIEALGGRRFFPEAAGLAAGDTPGLRFVRRLGLAYEPVSEIQAGVPFFVEARLREDGIEGPAERAVQLDWMDGYRRIVHPVSIRRVEGTLFRSGPLIVAPSGSGPIASP